MSAPLTLLAVSLITLSASSAATAATDVATQDASVRYPSYARVVHTKPIVRKHYERVPVRRCQARSDLRADAEDLLQRQGALAIDLLLERLAFNIFHH